MNEWASRITKEKKMHLILILILKKQRLCAAECCRVLPSAEGLGFVFFTSFEAVTTRLSNLDFGKKTPTSHGLSLISSILEKKKDKLRTLLLLLNEHSNLNIIFNSCLFFFFKLEIR